jgi:hypothetical protein
VARYDRIARLESPPREQAFPGWPVFRDLEGRERDPDLGRRASLRFLALRPVRRLLDHGFDGPGQASLDQQIDVVLRRLNGLPADDADRARLTSYVEEVRRRVPGDLARATLALGEASESDGQLFAAEELYQTGLEVARAHQLQNEATRARELITRTRRAARP